MSVSDLLDCLAPNCTGSCRDTWVAQAEMWISRECFGPMADMAVALVAAHLCTIYPEGGGGTPGGAGPITGLREGDTAVQFGFLQTIPADDVFWHRTPQGQQFLALQAASACSGPFLARSC